MNTIVIHTLIIISIVALAVGLYEGYDLLPVSWREWLADKKTKAIAVVTFLAPDVMAMVANIPYLGLEDYVPSTTMNIVLKVVAALTLISRLQSFWDTRLDAKGNM